MGGQSEVTVECLTSDPQWLTDVDGLEDLAGKAIQTAAEHLGARGEVAVLFCDDEESARLNAAWRGKSGPTDILSFPDDAPPIPGSTPRLGDLALSRGVTLRDAAQLNRPPTLHIQHLLVHGFLHLLGYDHIDANDAKVMEGLERDILAGLGLPDPYGDAA